MHLICLQIITHWFFLTMCCKWTSHISVIFPSKSGLSKEKFDFDLACGNNFVYKNLHASIVYVLTVLVFGALLMHG